MGDDRTSGAIRSLVNPNLHAQPDTYLGTYWYTGTSDNGGVHTNSGVMNYWFIWYQTGFRYQRQRKCIRCCRHQPVRGDNHHLCAYDYMTSTSNYNDLRTATLTAAKIAYGNCSIEAYQVANGWYAVGVVRNQEAFRVAVFAEPGQLTTYSITSAGEL